MNYKKFAIFLLIFFALFISACAQEGTAQKIGKKIDNVFNTAKNKIHQATK